ncbi:hypothetical protein BJ166DRAFT_494816 [Pestalotiopsis sp. NC0098]|nr:hypothetical protein BJ166DRAFT_494816 [Pestalotiopsis sp. NC0098]
MVGRYTLDWYGSAESLHEYFGPRHVDPYGDQSPSDEYGEYSSPYPPVSDAAIHNFWAARGGEDLPSPRVHQRPIAIAAVHDRRLLPAHERPINHRNGYNDENVGAVGQGDGSLKTQEELLGGGWAGNAYIPSPGKQKPTSTTGVSTKEVQSSTQGSSHFHLGQEEPQAADGAERGAQRTVPALPDPARLKKPSHSSDDSHQGRGEAKAVDVERNDAQRTLSAEHKPSLIERMTRRFESKLERVLGDKAGRDTAGR